MSRYATLPVAILLVCLLAGCAGLALLSLVFKALSVGALVGEVTNLFGHDADEFTLYLDGYDTGRHPNPDGTLNLDGLPVGHHVLTLADTDKTVGFHKHVLITAGDSLRLGSITTIQGGTISGRLRRQVGATTVPLAGVRVAAVFGGGDLIKQGTGRQVTLPPQNDTDTVIMGFTDDSGNYKLGPCAYESAWIVTAAYPGQLADVVVTQVTGGNSPTGVNLTLPTDPTAGVPPTVQGTVVKKSGDVLANALVALNLGAPFAPATNAATQSGLADDFGPLLDQPWFAWSSLATQTTTVGAYNLVGLAGTHSLYAFAYGYRAQAADATLTDGEVLLANITLQAR